jgi:outer membrane receptor protein involved in Fe transport
MTVKRGLFHMRRAVVLSAAACVGYSAALPVLAADQGAPNAPANAATDNASDGLALEEVVVTATANRVSKMDASVSVSTLDSSQLQQLQPTSAADVLRDIPGIRAEASGGEGNANVAVRGLPIASGGAKYVQFQEDGLPVLEYGDIAFATPDTFMRIDYNTDHVEVVRGGSASTFASNAPGGVFNFISKTGGDSLQGNVGISAGLDYNEQRYDFTWAVSIVPARAFGPSAMTTPKMAVKSRRMSPTISTTIKDSFGSTSKSSTIGRRCICPCRSR